MKKSKLVCWIIRASQILLSLPIQQLTKAVHVKEGTVAHLGTGHPWVDNMGKFSSSQLSSDQTSQQIHNYELIKWLTLKPLNLRILP